MNMYVKKTLLNDLQGAIWPSLSPCTVINPILLTFNDLLKYQIFKMTDNNE